MAGWFSLKGGRGGSRLEATERVPECPVEIARGFYGIVQIDGVQSGPHTSSTNYLSRITMDLIHETIPRTQLST